MIDSSLYCKNCIKKRKRILNTTSQSSKKHLSVSSKTWWDLLNRNQILLRTRNIQTSRQMVIKIFNYAKSAINTKIRQSNITMVNNADLTKVLSNAFKYCN